MIREATSADHRSNIEFMKGMEHASEFIKINSEYAFRVYDHMVKRGIATGLMKEVDGKVVGCLGFIMSTDLHSGEPIAIETFWFVDPAFRGQGYGNELFDAFEETAKRKGAKKVAMIHMSDSFPDILEKLYMKRGYRLLEKHYIKEI